MANFYTNTAAQLVLPTPEAVLEAIQISVTQDFSGEGDPEFNNFEVVDFTTGETPAILIRDKCGCADVEAIIKFVVHLSEKFGLTGGWGFSWADTCDKSRPDHFGGGAHFIDFDTGEHCWVDTTSWLKEQLA